MNWLENGLLAHDLEPPSGLIECDTVYDIGPGIRPMQWYRPEAHVCVEPCEAYCELLRNAMGYIVCNEGALDFLIEMDELEACYMLDVIEHMSREDGKRVLKLAAQKTRRQLVVYTPWGFVEQTTDDWGLGQHDWQKHRSGWVPEDFPGFEIERRGRGFFAVLTPNPNK